MFKITKTFTFSASHQLSDLPEDHQCARLHGHNYTITLELASGKLDKAGFVKDYGDLHEFANFVDKLDHRHLNNMFEFNPTAENVAQQLYYEARRLYGNLVTAVAVKETEKTWAEYRPTGS